MATVYVSPSGSDAYTYAQAQSSATPWQTIGKCNTSATTGDIISCLDGTHTWASVVFTKSFSLTASASSAVIFDAVSSQVSWSGLNTLSCTNISFKNNIGGASGTPAYTIFSKAANSQPLTFTNCVFENISLKDDGANTGGLFGTTTNHGSNAHVITLSNCRIQARRSTSNSASINSIFMCRVTTNNVYTVENCIFNLDGVTGSGTQVTNIFFNASTFANASVVWKNNIVYCPTSAVTWLQNTAFSSTNATYSDFYNFTSAPSGTGKITSDPLFVDPTNNNFNLQMDSPCIGTGSV